MATGDYRSVGECGISRLESLKEQLNSHLKDVARLNAAIAFLEANPGAEALVNSL